jgi:sulfopyruvate decarboxylase subunit beta
MLMPRIEALRIISREFPNEPIVFTCAATSREMASVDRRPNHLYVLDSMGLVSSIVLGLSLSLEDTPVNRCVGVEGDGAMLMNVNALSTIGYLQPRKLLLIVLDNQTYASTGGQPTHAERLDLASLAEACGLKTWRAQDEASLRRALAAASETAGPGFILMRIAKGNTQVPYLLDDPVTLHFTFASWLKGRLAGK